MSDLKNHRKFGLPDTLISKVKGVFLKHDSVLEVRLFGSRALGSFKEGSDIDLAVYGTKLNLDTILKIKVDLNLLHSPYSFDIVNMSEAIDSSLKEHIDRVGILFFSQKTSLDPSVVKG